MIVCKYSDVPTNEEGWVVNLKFLPTFFDMVNVMVVRDPCAINAHLRPKPCAVNAWFDGKKWIGLRLRDGDKITAWKRNPYD